jgi:predicted phosphodiesterase
MIDGPGPRASRWSRWRSRARDRTGRAGVRLGRLTGLGLLALGAAVVFGVTTASTQLSVGPHEARYDVTTDDTITLDLGPLGTLQLDSPLPLTLGARVTVQEIPADVRAVDPARTVEALGNDLQGYVQFFTAPQATIADAARALVLDAAARSSLALAALVAVAVLGRALLGAPRRAELAGVFAPRRRRLVGAGLLTLLVAVTAVSSLNPSERRPTGRAASSVFAGTALEGARITGRLAGVIDTYGGEVVNAYRENTKFYAGAGDALAAAWKARAAGTRARDAARKLVLTRPLDGSTPTPAPAAAAPVVLLVLSDLHCNVGMAPLIGSLAKLSGADVLLDAGDTTIDGTAVEQSCVSNLARAVPKGIPIVASNGNHDSSETAAQERRAGITVLDGTVVTVAGVRILGDDDPDQTRIGSGTSLVGRETAAQEGERLAKTACGSGKVDLLLIHTPSVGDAALQSGCVPIQVSGHLHVRVGPVAFGQGLRYASASTAGAAPGQPTVGPLRGTAELTVLRFDPDTRRLIDYQLVQVRPDGSASVSYRLPVPAVPAVRLQGDGSRAAAQAPPNP